MKYYIVDRKNDDEFILGVAESRDEAIAIAREEWLSMCDWDKEHNDITVRIYTADIEDANCECFDYDTIEWRI